MAKSCSEVQTAQLWAATDIVFHVLDQQTIHLQVSSILLNYETPCDPCDYNTSFCLCVSVFAPFSPLHNFMLSNIEKHDMEHLICSSPIKLYCGLCCKLNMLGILYVWSCLSDSSCSNCSICPSPCPTSFFLLYCPKPWPRAWCLVAFTDYYTTYSIYTFLLVYAFLPYWLFIHW